MRRLATSRNGAFISLGILARAAGLVEAIFSAPHGGVVPIVAHYFDVAHDLVHVWPRLAPNSKTYAKAK